MIKYSNKLPIKVIQSKEDKPYWVLVWYGRSFWNKKEALIYKEAYLVNISEKNYYINNWKAGRIVRVEIPEEKTFLFPLGTIINSEGKPLVYPKEGERGLYNMSVTLVSSKDRYEEDLYPFFEDSEMPVFPKTSNDNIYDGAPHYRCIKNVGIKEIPTDFIIPIHVINSYYYYISTKCIHHIIYGNIDSAFRKPFMENKEIIIPYDGDILSYQDAEYLARYFFVNGQGGINYLREIPLTFYAGLSNRFGYRGYMGGRIPFDMKTSLKVLGQYITEMNSDRKKFLVYRILDCWLERGSRKFTVDEYKFLNIHDKRSKDIEDDDPKHYTSIKHGLSRGSKGSELDGNGVDKTYPTQQAVDVNISGCFLEKPNSRLLDKEEQKNKYVATGIIYKEIESLDINYREHDPSSRRGRVNILSVLGDLNACFAIFELALKKLLDIDKGYRVLNMQINSKDSKYSAFFHAGVKYPMYISTIIYYNRHYCIVDAGFGNTIALFRYTDSSIPFRSYEDETVNLVIKSMLAKHRFSWRNAASEELLKIHNVDVLAPLNHPSESLDGEDKLAESLCVRIHKRIMADFAMLVD